MTTTTPSVGHERHDLAERVEHRREVGVEIGMIELDVADEEVLRLVVQELGAAVEERRVVLVAFEHEVGPGAAAITPAEILHLAADEEARIPSGVEEQPRRQRRGRRLAVGPRDDDRGLPRQQVLAHRLWQREDRQARGATASAASTLSRERRVPDDDHVAVGRDVLGGEPAATGIPRRSRVVDMGGRGCGRCR